MKKNIVWIMGILLLLCPAGCGTSANESSVSAVAENDSEAAQNAAEDVSENSEIDETAEEPEQNKGSFVGEAADMLVPDQRELITDFMETYYAGLSALEPQDMSHLFLETATDEQLLNESALEYATGLRRMQHTDLTLADYRYELDVASVETAENGNTDVLITETSTQNFSQHPEVDTKLYHIMHRFELQETTDGWRIASHIQWDSIYWNLLGEYWGWDIEEQNIPDAEAFFSERVTELLTESTQELEMRAEEIQETPKSFTYSYNRDEAVAYSSKWVGRRNEEWSDYTGRGGNCQNFVSQCLLAGGIPMDVQGDSQWMWNGEDDHSASWLGVDAFCNYAANNQGAGLAASMDVSYYEGTKGDLICMGSENDWNHIVIITEVIRDEEGNTVDYLVNSNTADVENFPVGAYPNPHQKLIKIYGWN